MSKNLVTIGRKNSLTGRYLWQDQAQGRAAQIGGEGRKTGHRKGTHSELFHSIIIMKLIICAVLREPQLSLKM